MKKILFAVLALTLILSVAALAAKPAPAPKYDYDGTVQQIQKASNPYARPGKAVTRVLIDGANVANIRSTLSPNCRSIAAAIGASADTVQIMYLGGELATYSLWHGYSLDNGDNWTTSNMVAAGQRPRYPSMVMGDNDDDNGFYRPMHGVFHLQVTKELYYVYESSSIGDGAWSYTNLYDGSTAVDWWTPAINRCTGTPTLGVSAQEYNTGAAGFTFSQDWGQNWAPVPIAAHPIFNDPGTQPAQTWINNDPANVIAFSPWPWYGDQGVMKYFVSADSGANFTGPYDIIPEGLFPQYRGGIWWYDYDAMTINGVPYVAWVNSDWTNYGGRGISGEAVFVAWPVDPANITTTAWNVRHVSEMWDTASSLGWYGVEPSLGTDAAGNIYIGWCPFGGSIYNTGAAVAMSADGGNTWTQALNLGDPATENIDPFEISREVGSTVYGVGINSAGAAPMPLECWQVPVADLQAQPVIAFNDRFTIPTPITYAELGSTPTPVSGDTLEFAWYPGFAYGGTYELTVSKTADWSADNYDLVWFPDSNDLLIAGMPSTGVWYYKVRSIRPDASTSEWSGIMTFDYQGSAVNTTDWGASGVAGKPTAKPVYGFALSAAYPNPVRGKATINFTLPKAGAYSMKVYNIAGQAVKTIDGNGAAGANSIGLETRDMANGVFFYQLTAGGNKATRKLTVVK